MRIARIIFFSVFSFLLIIGGLLLVLPHIHNVNASGPQTWYVRPDGGTRYSVNVPTGQCNGEADSPYPGSGVNQNCAFNDVRFLWTDGTYTVDTGAGSPKWGWIGSGGDTYIIRGGPWRVGQNGPNSTDWFGLAGNPQGAGAPSPLSGTPSNHTKILGENYGACSSQAARTQIFGGYGVGNVLSMNGVSYVDISCLDVSDHSACGRQGQIDACNTSYPLSDYASNGIAWGNGSTHDTINNVRIHGLASAGMIGPTGDGTVITNIDILGNASAGWNADPGNGTTGTGSLLVQNFNISWNGCAEEYPIVDTLPYSDCTDDDSSLGPTAGYGDGFGTATVTSTPPWNVAFNQGVVSYNTQDGLDALHIKGTGSSMTVTNVLAYGNMGQQIKVGGAHGVAINNVIVANCNAMRYPIPGTPAGYNNNLSDFCRAADTGIAMTVGNGSTLTYQNNTLYSANATGVEIDCDPTNGACNSTALIDFRNNIFLAFQNTSANGYPGGGSTAWSNPVYNGTIPYVNFFLNPGSIFSNNITYNQANSWNCPNTGNGEVNAICVDPQLTDEMWHLYGYGNMAPTAGSPAIRAGVTIPSITTDFNGSTRGNPPTIGAIEVAGSGGGSTPPPSDMTPPSIPTNLTISNITSSSISLSWTASTDNIGVLGYNIYRGGTKIATSLSASYINTGLTASTTYAYTVSAYDAAGNASSQSGSVNGTTSGAIGTSTPSSTPIGPTGYTFCSFENTNCSFSGTQSVAFGAGSSFFYLTLTNGTPCTDAVFTDPDVYVAKACFTKAPTSTPDTTPPTTSITSPLSGTPVSGITTIAASASDNVGVTSVALYIDGSLQGTDNASPYSFSLNTNALSNGLHTAYTKAYDAAGNIGTSGNLSITVTNTVASNPPSGGGGGGGSSAPIAPSFSITSISVDTITQTSAQITITTHLPASVAVKYGPTTLYGNTTQASPSLTTNYEKLTNLTPNTVYDFVVMATPPGGTQIMSPVSTFKTLAASGSAPVLGASPSGGGTTTASTPAFTNNLAYGDTNPEVATLQTILHTQGFLPGALGITNYFGAQTEHALLLFQSAHDLNKSGFVDLQTQSLLNKVSAAQGNAGVASPQTTTPIQTPSSGSLTRNLFPRSVGPDVMILQHILAQDGDYTAGIFSTHYGSLTQKAVQAFQTKYGIITYGTPYTTGYGAVGPRTRVRLEGMKFGTINISS